MTAFLLALCISLDSLAISINYGLKKIKINLSALFIIVFIIISVISITWAMGQLLLSFVSISIIKIISSILLVIIGSVFFIQAFFDCYFPQTNQQTLIRNFKIKPFKIIINIIREPSYSDMDNSGTIDIKEALFIGAALSIDSIVVGLSIAAYEISLITFLLLIALMNIIFLNIGNFLIEKLKNIEIKNELKLFSSSIIILIGFLKLL